MKELYKLKESLINELNDYAKGGLTASTLDTIDKLAHAAKNVSKVIECCEDEEYSHSMGGYSRRMSHGEPASYAYPDENYVRPDGSYSRRGRSRDAMGRYSGAEGSIDEHTKEELRKMIERM